jgi:hypothetical protein
LHPLLQWHDWTIHALFIERLALHSSFFHLDWAAFFAICRKRFEDSLFALAFPPLFPPTLPICARYTETGDRSGSGFSSLVSSLATFWARWLASSGSFLGFITLPLSHDIARYRGYLKFMLSHYRE